MSSLSLGLVDSLNSGLRVHLDMLSDDEAVLEQLTDVLSYNQNQSIINQAH